MLHRYGNPVTAGAQAALLGQCGCAILRGGWREPLSAGSVVLWPGCSQGQGLSTGKGQFLFELLKLSGPVSSQVLSGQPVLPTSERVGLFKRDLVVITIVTSALAQPAAGISVLPSPHATCRSPEGPSRAEPRPAH